MSPALSGRGARVRCDDSGEFMLRNLKGIRLDPEYISPAIHPHSSFPDTSSVPGNGDKPKGKARKTVQFHDYAQVGSFDTIGWTDELGVTRRVGVGHVTELSPIPIAPPATAAPERQAGSPAMETEHNAPPSASLSPSAPQDSAHVAPTAQSAPPTVALTPDSEPVKPPLPQRDLVDPFLPSWLQDAPSSQQTDAGGGPVAHDDSNSGSLPDHDNPTGSAASPHMAPGHPLHDSSSVISRPPHGPPVNPLAQATPQKSPFRSTLFHRPMGTSDGSVFHKDPSRPFPSSSKSGRAYFPGSSRANNASCDSGPRQPAPSFAGRPTPGLQPIIRTQTNHLGPQHASLRPASMPRLPCSLPSPPRPRRSSRLRPIPGQFGSPKVVLHRLPFHSPYLLGSLLPVGSPHQPRPPPRPQRISPRTRP